MGANRMVVRIVATALLVLGLALAWWIWPVGVEDPEDRLIWQSGAILVCLVTLVVVLKAWLETFQRGR